MLSSVTNVAECFLLAMTSRRTNDLTVISTSVCMRAMRQKTYKYPYDLKRPERKGHASDESNKTVSYLPAHRDNTGPYSCNQCDKTFANSDGLRYHRISSHTRKRYVCDQCGKAFARPADMTAHKRVHFLFHVHKVYK